MIKAKGFGVIPSLASNAANAISTVGELSRKAETFSKDVFDYNSPTVGEEVTLRLFSITDNNVASAIPTSIANKALTVCNGLYNFMHGLGNVSTTPQAIVSYLATQYGNEFTQLAVGDIVITTGMRMPSWLGMQTADGTVEFKVWFSNNHFVSQYDVHEIFLIPPVIDVNSLLTTNKASVLSALALQTSSLVIERLKDISDVSPYSELRTEHVDWVNTANPAETVDTVWTVVVRGGGVSLEDIKTAIKNYLNTNSSSVELFRQILPSLFGGTTFKITPHWDKISIPNATLNSSMYSSIINPTDTTAYALLTKAAETNAWIDAHVQSSFMSYKGLAFSMVGLSNNANNKYKLSEMYPDYLPIQTTSPDFNRLAPTTQAFIQLIMSMVMYAEVLDVNTPLPAGLTQQVDAGIVYVAGTLNGITYLMASKASIDI